MSRIGEKIAYLDGLMDGMNVQEEKYGKLFKAIVDALNAISEEISDHEDVLDDLEDRVQDLRDDLDLYEDVFFGEDEDDSFSEEEDEEDETDDDFYEIICPNCGEKIYFDEDMLDSPDGLICPNCNEPVEIHIPESLPEDIEF